MPQNDEPIHIDTLDPSQLQKLRDQVAQDIERLTGSSLQLQRAASRFEHSSRAIQSLSDMKEGHKVLLPLTESLYVNGEVADTKNVKVDIGTNYFVEMTTEGGMQLCERKVEKINAEIEGLGKVIKNKQNALTQVNLVLQQKIFAQQQAATKKP